MFESILSWFKKKNFVDFSWIKKAKFIELDNIDVSEDPVRPELDLDWRKSYDRKIYGLEYNNEIEAIMCLAFTNDVPHTVRELDLMSKVNKYEENADTIIAYTVWSKKKGAGQKNNGRGSSICKNKWFQKSGNSISTNSYGYSLSY